MVQGNWQLSNGDRNQVAIVETWISPEAGMGSPGRAGVLQVSLPATGRLKLGVGVFVVLMWLSVHGE